MMVHIQNTSPTGRAVVTPLRLEHIAHQAVSLSLGLMVPEMEPPEGGHLAGVCEHCSEEAPYEQNEEQVEEREDDS